MTDLFDTCAICVAKDWCKRRSGEVKLPDDYLAAFCTGYDKLERALQLANVPPEYRAANRRTYKVDEDNRKDSDVIIRAMENIIDIVQQGINIAFVHPNKGTGKTYSSLSILNEFIYKTCLNPEWFDYEHPVALYVKFGKWANLQRQQYSENGSDLSAKANRENRIMMDVPLLVIDDIGSGRITPFIRDLFYDIIDHRKEYKKATIFTSNFTDVALRSETMLGDMIVSRLFYNTVVLELGGRDRRATPTF